MRVFVSYSRAQFYFAEDLALALQEHGIDAWFDVHRLQPGEDWAGSIAEGLRASQAFVLVASRAALSSRHVQDELGLARQLGLPVVVVLTERMSLPSQLAEVPSFDLRRGFERKLGALVGALHSEPVALTSGGQAGVVWMLLFVLFAGALLCRDVVAVAHGVAVRFTDPVPRLAVRVLRTVFPEVDPRSLLAETEAVVVASCSSGDRRSQWGCSDCRFGGESCNGYL